MIPKYATLRVRETLSRVQTVKIDLSKKKHVKSSRSSKVCTVCGNNLLIPSGTCFVCQICGTSLGCS